MKTRARAALSAASILIVAAGAAGCGGGGGGSDSASDAPDGTSKSDFCGAFSTFEKNLSTVDPSSDPKTIVAKFKSEANKLKDTGTPSDIPADAKAGFAAVLDAIDGLPDDASLEDLSKLDSSLSDTDKKNGQSFETYLGTECPDLGTGTSSDSGSGGASDGASDGTSDSASSSPSAS